MRKFVIERGMLAVGTLERKAMRKAAQGSNEVLAQLAPNIQWVHSYVTGDKIFCLYLAKDEDVIREHARRTGLPANIITEVRRVIDPTTAAA